MSNLKEKTLHFDVLPAENGYILLLGPSYDGQVKIIAHEIDDLLSKIRDHISAELCNSGVASTSENLETSKSRDGA